MWRWCIVNLIILGRGDDVGGGILSGQRTDKKANRLMRMS